MSVLLTPNLLNTLPTGEEGNDDLIPLWDAAREQPYALTLGRLLALAGGGITIEDGGSPVGSATTLNLIGFTVTDQGGGLIDVEVVAGVDGTGTGGTVALWSDADTIGDSIVTQVSTTGIEVDGYLGAGGAGASELPTAGTLRLPTNFTIYYRDAGGNSRLVMRGETNGSTSGSHIVFMGNSSGATEFRFDQSKIYFGSGGTFSTRGIEDGGSGRIDVNGWRFDGTPNAGNLVWGGAGGGGNSIGSTGMPVYGLFVGTIDFRTASDGAGAATGTLTNAPSAGNPFWLPIQIGGVNYWLPAWTT